MSTTEIIILGTNGNCLDIADAVELLARQGESMRVHGFLDDADAVQGQQVAGYPVLGRIADAAKFSEARFVNGIGSPRSYRRKAEIVGSANVPANRWATIIHPSAVVSSRAQVGRGCVLLANVSLGAGVRLGEHVIVLQNSVISHDSTVGNFTAVATGVCVSGLCIIGTNCYLGSNSAVRDGIRIGDGALVGLGAVVVKDVPANAVVMGNPARSHS